ncbi:inactive protein kinase [Senna tora]|uniref:Inactive protein kinase n=1 Tax=Senna tora TaxID=362788 RepID=A0A834WRP9_9FABA|nr:inactive protein kinase [Senna tora]
MGTPNSHSYVIIACDATKDLSENVIKLVVGNVQRKGGILRAGDNLLVLGVLHKVSHPNSGIPDVSMS